MARTTGQTVPGRFPGPDQRFLAILKTADAKEADACLARVEDNLRLVGRGRLTVPAGADVGLFFLFDGKLEQPVGLARTVRLAELFATDQSQFTAGAKEVITRAMEDTHMNHVTRLLGGDTPVSAITAGVIQQFVDARSRETWNGHPVEAKTVRKAVATFRFVWNWANHQGHVPTKFPEVELVFAKEKQAEPFRTYDQIAAILARGGVDTRRERDVVGRPVPRPDPGGRGAGPRPPQDQRPLPLDFPRIGGVEVNGVDSREGDNP